MLKSPGPSARGFPPKSCKNPSSALIVFIHLDTLDPGPHLKTGQDQVFALRAPVDAVGGAPRQRARWLHPLDRRLHVLHVVYRQRRLRAVAVQDREPGPLRTWRGSAQVRV